MKTIKEIAVIERVPLSRIADMLCSAFDPVPHAVRYWATIERYEEPAALAIRSDANAIYRYMDYPVNEGGAIILKLSEPDNAEEEKKEMRLDLEAIQRGAQIMLREYPKHWAAFRSENDDIETADVFIQCCVFGEIVYG